jgi:hypothetical protein
MKLFKTKKDIGEKITSCKRNLKQYIKDCTRIQKDLFKLSDTTVEIKCIKNDEARSDNDEEDLETSADTTAIYKTLDENFANVLPFVEETIDRWNSRTHILKNLS